MLNCVYHPIDAMRLVEEEERERLLASGFWFDSPLDALAKRRAIEQHVEEEIDEEKQPEPEKVKVKKEKKNG